MKNSAKSTIKCVITLSLISVICVAVLALGNAFIPKYKPTLDAATAELINGIVDTGVGAETALEDGYFEMLQIDDKKLEEFNKANRVNSDNKLLAVYKVVKGADAGCFVTETQAKAYNDAVIILTAFDKSGNVKNLAVKSHSDDLLDGSIFKKEMIAKLVEYAKTVKTFDTVSLNAATGATTKGSTLGVANALNIAVKAAEQIAANGGEKL